MNARIEEEDLKTLLEIGENFKGYNISIGNRFAFISRDGKSDMFKIKD